MIRHANSNDLLQIAKIHIACFPDSFSTQIGADLLIKMYSEYIERTPELFFVAEENNNVVGFANGYYCEWNKYLSEFEKKNRQEFYMKIILLLLKGNKQAWKKAFKVIKRSNKTQITDSLCGNYSIEQKGDLLSICVLEDYRGKSIASNLLEQFELEMRNSSKHIKVITLSVDPKNGRGISFYKKMGYSQYKTSKTTASYYKLISEEV